MDTSPAAALARQLDSDVPHLGGPAAALRQVLAAHLVRNCEHVVEIGGHPHPLTDYLTHAPRSVLMVDPRAVPFTADTLRGRPCQVRHLACKFQSLDYDYAPGSYGLVMLGFSLKPFGSRTALDATLLALLDGARVVVIDYAPALERAGALVPHIVARDSLRVQASLDLVLDDDCIRGSPYACRRLLVLEPSRPYPGAPQAAR